MSDRSKEEDLSQLSSWLREQPHLPHDVCDDVLRCFVCGTKSLEEAKRRLDSYFSIRSHYQDFFSFSGRDATSPDFKKASKASKIFFLPKPTPEGYRVVFNIITDDFQLFDHRQEITRNMMLLELAMIFWPDMTGLVFVYDMRNVTKILPKISLTYTANALQWFQGTYPLKMKKAVLFNSPSLLTIFINTVVRGLMKSKLFDRIIVTPCDENCVKEYISQYLLPSDYGGEELTSDQLNEYWLEMLVKQKDWFKETSNQFSDESKRPKSSKNIGLFGNFRRIVNHKNM